MTSTQLLKDKYGIETTWKNGKVFFYNFHDVFKNGQYEEASLLMRDVEEHEQPPEDIRIIIKARKCLLVLYPDEVFSLVSSDMDLFEKALRRGKSELRMRKTAERGGQ